MEKYYIVRNEQFINQVERDIKIAEDRKNFIKQFFSENGIDGEHYYFSGTGFTNIPFKEDDKGEIRLHIEDTEHNREKYGKQFKKSRFGGLVGLRKGSELLKRFQAACIEAGVVINRGKVRPGDYFKELNLGGYASERFLYKGLWYLKINTDHYNDKEIIPAYDGFEEIKASEYYKALEVRQAQEQNCQ